MNTIDIVIGILTQLVYYLAPALALWVALACVVAWWRTKSFPTLTLRLNVLFGRVHKDIFKGSHYLSTAATFFFQTLLWAMQVGFLFDTRSFYLDSVKLIYVIGVYVVIFVIFLLVLLRWHNSPGYSHPADLLLFQQPKLEYWCERKSLLPRTTPSSVICFSVTLVASVLAALSIGAQPCRWLDLIIHYSGCTRALNWNTHTTAMAISPDRKFVVTEQFRDANLRIYDLESGKVVQQLVIPNPDVVQYQKLYFSRNSSMLLASGIHHMHIWSIATKQILYQLDLPDDVWVLVLNHSQDVTPPNAKILAELADGTRVIAWRGYPGRTEKLSPDISVTAVDEETRVDFRNTQDFAVISTFTSTLRPNFNSYRSNQTLFSSDNTLFAYRAIESNSVLLWRVKDGSLIGVFNAPNDRNKRYNDISTLVISPKNTWLAAGALDGTVKVWRIADGKLMHTFDLAGTSLGAEHVFFTGDDDIIAAASYGSVFQWHLSSSKGN